MCSGVMEWWAEGSSTIFHPLHPLRASPTVNCPQWPPIYDLVINKRIKNILKGVEEIQKSLMQSNEIAFIKKKLQ